jgi:hypothetical protein
MQKLVKSVCEVKNGKLLLDPFNMELDSIQAYSLYSCINEFVRDFSSHKNIVMIKSVELKTDMGALVVITFTQQKNEIISIATVYDRNKVITRISSDTTKTLMSLANALTPLY